LETLKSRLVTRVGSGNGRVEVAWGDIYYYDSGGDPWYAKYTVTAVPDSGWKFAYWMAKEQGSSAYYQGITNPTSDAVVASAYAGNENEDVYEAYFEEDPEYQPTDHTITVVANPSDGGTVSGGGTYADGATCTISATAASGYHFIKWGCSDGREIADASYTFAVSASLTFTARFEEGTGLPLYDGTSGEILFGKNGEILFDG